MYMKQEWNHLIQKNFDNAAATYNDHAKIQQKIALELTKLCSQKSIPEGIWVDLGSGTGLLAEALESFNPNQQIIRVDSSKQMISQQRSQCLTKIWDLNLGLPNFQEPPKLLASNFVLHWLNDPTKQLKEWFNVLDFGGWIALSVPVQGSFPEWYKATSQACVPCTALELPSSINLLKVFPKKAVHYQKLMQVTQKAQSMNGLFKTMTNVGAQASPKTPLSIGQWRRLKNSWPIMKDGDVNLTWVIQILLVKK